MAVATEREYLLFINGESSEASGRRAEGAVRARNR